MPQAIVSSGPKLLYRRLDSLFGSMDHRRPPRRLLESFLEDLLKTLGQDMGWLTARLYAERDSKFVLIKRAGQSGPPDRREIPLSAAPIELLLQHRTYIYTQVEKDISPATAGILPPGDAAGIVVGQPPDRHLFFFQLAPGWNREETDFAFNTVRSALDSRLLEHRSRGTILEAAEVQKSLLLDRAPNFPGYDIACLSIPAEEVGGDFFDFISFAPEVLGLAVGDASGHGLPAALLVRDVVTGLRMGLERDLKVVPVFTKLNRVIHRSKLTSRFVSVFYGELETNGNFIYLNAGHQPPLLFSARGVESLTIGGTVIGPLPEVTFKRGFAHVDRGATLLITTDGLIERQDATGDQFGEERMIALIEKHPAATAAQLVEMLFDACYAFGSGRPWEDDATAVVVKRLPKTI
jgi:sigma-B regulation protein RsbU (phosphoserine phosphatase)